MPEKIGEIRHYSELRKDMTEKQKQESDKLHKRIMDFAEDIKARIESYNKTTVEEMIRLQTDRQDEALSGKKSILDHIRVCQLCHKEKSEDEGDYKPELCFRFYCFDCIKKKATILTNKDQKEVKIESPMDKVKK